MMRSDFFSIAARILRQAEPPAPPEFLLASQGAIDAFAEGKFRSLAECVRDDIRKYPPTYIYDEPARDLWDEYRYHVTQGSSPLDASWEQTFQPHVTKHVDALPTTIKVLLTIAGQSWRTEYDDQDGETVDEALLFGAVWDELVRLADEDPETEPEDFQSVSQDDNFAQAIVSNLN